MTSKEADTSENWTVVYLSHIFPKLSRHSTCWTANAFTFLENITQRSRSVSLGLRLMFDGLLPPRCQAKQRNGLFLLQFGNFANFKLSDNISQSQLILRDLEMKCKHPGRRTGLGGTDINQSGGHWANRDLASHTWAQYSSCQCSRLSLSYQLYDNCGSHDIVCTASSHT